ncbi:MAG: acyltransferase [Actinomycetota bacterium]|nr:acyltransferase [Actinomycetota bacterium]
MADNAAPMVADTAIVEPGASVGAGSRVWHHAHVRSGASIGSEVTVGEGAFVDAGVIVGDRSKIQNGAQLFAPAVVDAGTFVGPGVILTNDLHPRAVAPDGSTFGSADWTAVGCRVGRGASLGAASTVVCTEVGEWAMVAAGSVVVEPVAPHALVAGVPARQIGWVCYCGTRQSEGCAVCGWSVP